MLGHSDLKVTEVYLRAAGVDVKAAHKKTHPREKEKEKSSSLRPRIERIRPKYEHKS